MSQNNIDGEFEALLNSDDMADIEAAVGLAANPDLKSPAGVKATPAATQEVPAATTQETKQAVAAPKPTIGKKRQLLVPQGGSNKRVSLQVEASNATATKASSPAPAAASEASPATTEAQTSTASPTAMAKPTASPAASADDQQGTETKVEDMEVDAAAAELTKGDDAEMPDAGAVEEPEVQSPLKKAPTTDTKPASTATTAPSASAIAAGKRKGLTVAKAGTETSELTSSAAAKPKAAGPSHDNDKSTTNAKLPHAQTAFFFFSQEKRPGLKESMPGLSMGEYAKKLGTLWGELSKEDKKPYNDKAIADKERAAAELAAMDPEVVKKIKQAAAEARASKKEKKAGPSKDQANKDAAKAAANQEKAQAKAERAAQKKAAKAAKAEALKSEQAAWKVYHSMQYATFKADNPGVEAADLNQIMMKAWAALEQADKDIYQKKADEATEAAAAAKAARNASKSSKATGKKGKRASKSDAGDDDEDGPEGAAAAAAAGGSRSRRAAAVSDDDDEESDREDVDWDSNPADAILSTGAGSYLVARKGLMLTDYGTCTVKKVKEHLLHRSSSSSSSSGLPVTAEQVSEFDASTSRFWAAVKSRMHNGGVDLEELEEGSPLEMCYLLGKLQGPGHLLDPKARLPKGDLDVIRRLPVMRLSMVVQRLMDLERRRTSDAQKEATQFKEGLTKLLAAVQDKGGKALQDDPEVAAAAALLNTA